MPSRRQSKVIEDCTAIILTGGQSTRMGQDKAQLLLGGESLLQRAISCLQPLFSQLMLSVRQPIQGVSLPQVVDESHADAGGPMLGICAALATVDTPWIFVMAVDMPFVSPDIIRDLAKQRGNKQAVVAKCDGHVQPLLAYYAQSCLPILQQHIQQGKCSLKQLIPHLDSIIVENTQFLNINDHKHSFFDLDSPKDVEKARYILKKRENP